AEGGAVAVADVGGADEQGTGDGGGGGREGDRGTVDDLGVAVQLGILGVGADRALEGGAEVEAAGGGDGGEAELRADVVVPDADAVEGGDGQVVGQRRGQANDACIAVGGEVVHLVDVADAGEPAEIDGGDLEADAAGVELATVQRG